MWRAGVAVIVTWPGRERAACPPLHSINLCKTHGGNFLGVRNGEEHGHARRELGLGLLVAMIFVRMTEHDQINRFEGNAKKRGEAAMGFDGWPGIQVKHFIGVTHCKRLRSLPKGRVGQHGQPIKLEEQRWPPSHVTAICGRVVSGDATAWEVEVARVAARTPARRNVLPRPHRQPDG